jgi:hypothetical protein
MKFNVKTGTINMAMERNIEVIASKFNTETAVR